MFHDQKEKNCNNYKEAYVFGQYTKWILDKSKKWKQIQDKKNCVGKIDKDSQPICKPWKIFSRLKTFSFTREGRLSTIRSYLPAFAIKCSSCLQPKASSVVTRLSNLSCQISFTWTCEAPWQSPPADGFHSTVCYREVESWCEALWASYKACQRIWPWSIFSLFLGRCSVSPGGENCDLHPRLCVEWYKNSTV